MFGGSVLIYREHVPIYLNLWKQLQVPKKRLYYAVTMIQLTQSLGT